MVQNNSYDTTITSLLSYSLGFTHFLGMVSYLHLTTPTGTLTLPSFIHHCPQYTASSLDTSTQMAGVMIQVSTPISYMTRSPLFPSNTKKTGMIGYQLLIPTHVHGVSLLFYSLVVVLHIVVSSVGLRHRELQLKLGNTCDWKENWRVYT